MPGDGGLYSTGADLAKWGHFLSGESSLGSQIPLTLREELPVDDGTATNYGHGMRVNWGQENGRHYIWHGGSWNDAVSHCNFFPPAGGEPAVWFVVLGNSASIDVEELVDNLRDFYFARPLRGRANRQPQARSRSRSTRKPTQRTAKPATSAKLKVKLPKVKIKVPKLGRKGGSKSRSRSKKK